MVYRQRGERIDSKRVRDDLDRPSGQAELTWGGDSGCGLHGICFYKCDYKTRKKR